MNDIGVSSWMTYSKLSRACAPVCGCPPSKTVCGFLDKRCDSRELFGCSGSRSGED